MRRLTELWKQSVAFVRELPVGLRFLWRNAQANRNVKIPFARSPEEPIPLAPDPLAGLPSRRIEGISAYYFDPDRIDFKVDPACKHVPLDAAIVDDPISAALKVDRDHWVNQALDHAASLADLHIHEDDEAHRDQGGGA